MVESEGRRMMRIESEGGYSEEVEVILAFEFVDNKKNTLFIQRTKWMKLAI